MSNQENILMMDGNGIMKNSNGNVIAKGVMIKSAVISSTPSIEDLVKRIESLEKQLADMQKATSCDLDILSTRITAVESFSR
ncbi:MULTISPECIES: hypothetical protein [Proteus]|uniref:Uncharacterized protein n=1 Tax=Proteus penneri TaxID=102862 RepID=A0A0G4Q3D6_9GAMM|nr:MULTISPECIES: hypothetical protein [Proteus]MDF7175510.1 hypothetical protein [Proteus mirabilis]MDF7479383.1 hypothetical protein [Proteus mirabilis]MDM9024668.1 hypothetical protein [Proteus mirabilis]OIK54312.1 hypothetical protein BE839_09860 [Proteus mirabilis]TFT57912.1 hypothetical protein E4V45_15910 [Proteus mirabilis]